MKREQVLPNVMADMAARIAKGADEYGEPLTTGNGRDALVDGYEEALDLAMYLKQAIMERDALRGTSGLKRYPNGYVATSAKPDPLAWPSGMNSTTGYAVPYAEQGDTGQVYGYSIPQAEMDAATASRIVASMPVPAGVPVTASMIQSLYGMAGMGPTPHETTLPADTLPPARAARRERSGADAPALADAEVSADLRVHSQSPAKPDYASVAEYRGVFADNDGGLVWGWSINHRCWLGVRFSTGETFRMKNPEDGTWKLVKAPEHKPRAPNSHRYIGPDELT